MKSNQEAEINFLAAVPRQGFGSLWCTVAKKQNVALGITAFPQKKTGKHQHHCFQKNVVVSHVGTLYPCLDPLPRFKWNLADNAFWS